MTGVSNLIVMLREYIRVIESIKNGEELPPNVNLTAQGSLVKLNNMFLVRPRIIVSDDLKYMDPTHFKNIVDSNVKIFSAYFVQAIKIINNIYGLDIASTMDILNRKPDIYYIVRNVNNQYVVSNESCDYSKLSSIMAGFEKQNFLPIDKNIANKVLNKDKQLFKGFEDHVTELEGKDDLTKLEQTFIKTYDIQVVVRPREDDRRNERVISLPVTVFPVIVFTDMKRLVEDLSADKVGATFKERWEEFRSGAISLSDLIFASDLIKKYKERRLKNRSDLSDYIKTSKKISDVVDVVRGNISFNKNFNIYIMSYTDKYMLDNIVKGDILREKYKNKILDMLLAFSLNLVDSDKERLVMLIKDIEGFNVYNFNMLKSKGKNDDINDVLKNLLVGRPPF